MSQERLAVVIPAYNEQERIASALFSLELQDAPLDVVVVDNNSTDETVDACLEIGSDFSNTNLHIIAETEQGTGAAADTGFRYAMEELGAQQIARIDADTQVLPGWVERINHQLSKKNAALVTGPAIAGGDGGVNFFEAVVLPRIKTAAKVARTIRHLDLGYLYFAIGHNMATTAEAYHITGGFPRTDFITTSDDLAYTKLISEYYGVAHMHYDRRMMVMTSQRRLRRMGYIAAARFYTTSDPELKRSLQEMHGFAPTEWLPKWHPYNSSLLNQ